MVNRLLVNLRFPTTKNTLIAVYGCGYESRATLRKRPSTRCATILPHIGSASDLHKPGAEYRTWHARPRDQKETYIGRTICSASNAGTSHGSLLG
jgi:hypothetical protein